MPTSLSRMCTHSQREPAITRLREMLEDGANTEDIAGFLLDRRVPGDEATLLLLAREVLRKPPEQGYLTISNALQWRLQYSHALGMAGHVKGLVRCV